MKRIFVFMVILCLSMPVWGQTAKKGSKNTETQSKELTEKGKKGSEQDSVKQNKSKDTKGKKVSSKAKATDSKDKKSSEKTKGKPAATKAAPKSKAAPKPAPRPAPRPSSSRGRSKTPAPEPVTIVTYYQDLPLSYLPQLIQYIERKKQEDPRSGVTDSKDLRTGFIKNKDTERGYLNLQRPGESRYTRLQEFKTEDGKLLVAVENTDCMSDCSNNLRIYRKDSAWVDVTDQYLPQVDNKAVVKMLKDAYKDEYLDLDLYNAKGYENPDNLKKAIMYTISPDENKIVIKEQYLPLPLYDLSWDPKKAKFEMKKR